MARLFERAAIIGVGLIGGSLALAARREGLFGQVVGVGRSTANLKTAEERGILDRVAGSVAEIGPVDLVVLAMPVRMTEAVARDLAPHLHPGTIVSDVGSVKGSVVSAAEATLPADCPFVGAHPIAGSERSGAAAADADLFYGSRCVLTPTERTVPAALDRVEALWRGVGARVERMSPAAHDRALAWTSHLPHVISYALARAIDEADRGLFAFAGPSLRDATRVAASSPELWRDIFLANVDAVTETIALYRAELDLLAGAIERRDEAEIERLLTAARAARARLEGRDR